MRVIAIIPCRGGSKGIYRKNIADLAGKPLMAYTIEQAQASDLITDVVVSTEDIEIQDVAMGCGASIISRPGLLARDDVMVWDVIKNAAETYQASHSMPELFVELHTTYPFRQPSLIDDTIKDTIKEIDKHNYDGAMVVSELYDRVWRWGYCGGYDRIPSDLEIRPRQSQEPLYIDHYGLVNVYTPKLALQGNPYNGNLTFHVCKHKLWTKDIDEPTDLWVANALMKYHKDHADPKVRIFPPSIV